MDYTDVVARVKDSLVQRGIDLSGPCGAFEITSRVAWELRGKGAGLYSKTSGNNCHGYSVDGIVFQNPNEGYDILIASGEANGPAWQRWHDENGQIIDPLPNLWRAPFQVDNLDNPPSIPLPPVPTGSGTTGGSDQDVKLVLEIIADNTKALNRLAAIFEKIVSVFK